MNSPMTAIIPLADFDPLLLPEGAREPGSAAFKEAVSDIFAQDFVALGGSAQIVVDDEVIRVTWEPLDQVPNPISAAVGVLRRGQLEHGVRMLRFIESAYPDDPTLHFNLGAALSDMGQLDEAVTYLEKAISIALLELKYHGIHDATEELGAVAEIRDLFVGFQRHLFEKREEA